MKKSKNGHTDVRQTADTADDDLLASLPDAVLETIKPQSKAPPELRAKLVGLAANMAADEVPPLPDVVREAIRVQTKAPPSLRARLVKLAGYSAAPLQGDVPGVANDVPELRAERPRRSVDWRRIKPIASVAALAVLVASIAIWAARTKHQVEEYSRNAEEAADVAASKVRDSEATLKEFQTRLDSIKVETEASEKRLRELRTLEESVRNQADRAKVDSEIARMEAIRTELSLSEARAQQVKFLRDVEELLERDRRKSAVPKKDAPIGAHSGSLPPWLRKGDHSSSKPPPYFSPSP